MLRPGGRAALAVWAEPERNPWATIPTRALVELGHAEPPDPNAPGMFALADGERLRGLLEEAGFLDVVVEPLALERLDASAEQFVRGTLDLSAPFARGPRPAVGRGVGRGRGPDRGTGHAVRRRGRDAAVPGVLVRGRRELVSYAHAPCSTTTTQISNSSTARPSRSSGTAPRATPTP